VAPILALLAQLGHPTCEYDANTVPDNIYVLSRLTEEKQALIPIKLTIIIALQ